MNYQQVFLEATQNASVAAIFSRDQIQIVLDGVGRGINAVVRAAQEHERLLIIGIVSMLESSNKVPQGTANLLAAQFTESTR